MRHSTISSMPCQNAIREWQPTPVEMRAISAVIALLMFLRGYNMLTNATFWCDDGGSFFGPAYNSHGGWRLILTPFMGYFQIVERLAAQASYASGLSLAPTVDTAIALAIATIPIFYIMSGRLLSTMAPANKLAASVYYALTPLPEVFGNTSDTHFIVWPAMIAIALSTPPPSKLLRLAENTLLAVLAFSGPEIVFVCLALWAGTAMGMKPRRAELFLASACCAAACITLWHFAAAHHSPRIFQIKPYTMYATFAMATSVASRGFSEATIWPLLGLAAFAWNITCAIREKDAFRTVVAICAIMATVAACCTFDSGPGAARYHTYLALALAISFGYKDLLTPNTWPDIARTCFACALLINFLSIGFLLPKDYQSQPTWRQQVDAYRHAPATAGHWTFQTVPGWPMLLSTRHP